MTVNRAILAGFYPPPFAGDTAFRPEGVTLFRKGYVSDLVPQLGQVLAAPRAGSSPARSLAQLYSERASPGDDDAQFFPPRWPAASS